MAMLSQGTEIYFIDPEYDSNGYGVREIDCATTFNPGGNPADQLETTCLSDTTRSYEPGLRTPGQAAIGINADPRNASHIRLYELSQDDPQLTLKFAVGWSDGIGIAPTVDSNGEFVLPTTRTWFTFSGYVADFPFDFSQNTVVKSDISVQRSGGSSWVKKV